MSRVAWPRIAQFDPSANEWSEGLRSLAGNHLIDGTKSPISRARPFGPLEIQPYRLLARFGFVREDV